VDNLLFTKSAQLTAGDCTPEDLKKINRFAVQPLTAEEVYVVKIAMCDTAVDRDYEHFTERALKTLAKLFVGRTVVKDHRPSADNQIGRIYHTEVVKEGAETKAIAYCYTLRTEKNADLIREINGGIKREVSVGFSCKTARCDICGVNKIDTWCSHRNGKSYDGVECTVTLDDIIDAYELSFVGVPAQRNAGVTKNYGIEEPKETEPESSEAPSEASNADNIKSLDLRMRIANTFINITNESEEPR